MIYVYFLFFFFFFLLSFWRKDLSLIFFILALPLYLIRFSFFGLPTTFLEIVFFLYLLVFLFKDFDFSFFRVCSKNYFFWPIVFLLISVLVSLFHSVNFFKGLGIAKAYFFEPIILFFVLSFYEAKKTEISWRAKIILSFSLLAWVLVLFSFYQKLTGFMIPYPWFKESERRVVGFFEYPNALALFLGPLIPLFSSRLFALGKIKKESFFWFVYWGGLIICSFFAIYFARSTGALVALFGSLFLIFLFWFIKSLLSKELTKKRIFWVLFGLFLFSVVFVFGFSHFQKELLFKDWSGKVRQKQYQETWEFLKDNFLLGAGLNSYQTKIIPYHKQKGVEIFLYPHNLIFTFWVELGLLGVFSFLWLLGKIIKKLSQNFWQGDLFSLFLLGSFLEVLIHGLVDVPYFKNDLSFLFWLLVFLTLLGETKKPFLLKP